MRGAPAGAGRAGDGPGGVGHPLLLLVALAGVLPAALACTSIIVGGGATADGSVYMARTDDTGDARSTVNNLVYHDPRSSPAVFRSNANGLRMELPAPGLAYLALPVILADPAAGRNASGEEAGVNSAGVAISGTETIANSPAALAADPYTADGLIEDAIPSLLLPQATSAPHGAGVLGALIATHGAGEGFGVLLADAVEAWYLETASGHHWLAQRVPEGTAFVAANQGRLQVGLHRGWAVVMGLIGPGCVWCLLVVCVQVVAGCQRCPGGQAMGQQAGGLQAGGQQANLGLPVAIPKPCQGHSHKLIHNRVAFSPTLPPLSAGGRPPRHRQLPGLPWAGGVCGRAGPLRPRRRPPPQLQRRICCRGPYGCTFQPPSRESPAGLAGTAQQ